MLDAPPGQVGDVQQAVDAAQVDERAIVGNVLDDALDHCAFLERFQQGLALGALARFQHRAAGNHHVVALAVELDDLEFHLLALVRGGVLDRADVHQRAGQERTDAVHRHREAALDRAADHAGNQGAVFHSLFQVVPGRHALGFFARQLGFDP